MVKKSSLKRKEPEPATVAEAVQPENNTTDPYLLEDLPYIQSEHRWTNRQRTLVLGSRGISHRYRHLVKDVQTMLPHSKAEVKFEKSGNLSELVEIAELRSCNNVIYFECRKNTLLYMYISCPPFGPTLKFQVLNVHTLGELRLTGNSLRASRPLLNFDEAFDQPEKPELRLMKAALTRAFGVPRNHPKSQPFFDRVFSFFHVDGKIWFRAYQISPSGTVSDSADPEHQVLTEIGPRFVLEPVVVQDGAFGGKLLFKNAQFESPGEILRKQRQAKLAKATGKADDRERAKSRKRDAAAIHDGEEDPEDLFDDQDD